MCAGRDTRNTRSASSRTRKGGRTRTDRGSSRILIVDDEAGIRDILARLLRQEGYEVLAAADGTEALASVQRDSPDALLLDIRLPGVSGIEVLRQAKRLKPDLAVVVIASDVSVTNAVEALRLGASSFVGKPFDHTAVIRSLKEAIG